MNEPSDKVDLLSKYRLEISVELRPFLNSAITRIGYLFPAAQINPRESHLDIALPAQIDFESLKKQLLYTIYREKIREEGKDSRQALSVAVFGR
ncbi:hypothetical protein [Roseibium sp. SCP14]|uniref:hypothetical protein n=1 Tax=Roseibium sp. SCP14 TaxID=3141375 RepID=UPI00333D608D